MEDGIIFGCFLFLSSLLFLDLGPVQMASARDFTTSQWRWSCPVRWIRQKVSIELYQSVVGLMGSYDSECRMIVSVIERNVTCPAPGNCTHIVIATTLRSLPKILLLTSPLDLTRAPCSTVYHSISRIPTQPDAGIRALTLFWIFQIPDTFRSRDRASYLFFKASRLLQNQQFNAN